MAEFAFEFWNRVDNLRGKTTLSELAERIGIKDQSLRAMRSQNRYPKASIMKLLAIELGTSTSYLVYGKDAPEQVEEQGQELCTQAQYVQNNSKARDLIDCIIKKPELLDNLLSILEER